MTYTYVIGKNPTAEDFKALCKRIGELYPEYEKRGGKKYADGAENARWEKVGFAITAELTAAPAVLTVTSDEELSELESEYRLKDRRVYERREQQFFYDTFLSSGARVKFLLIPGIFYVGWAAYALITCIADGFSIGDTMFFSFLLPVLGMGFLGMLFGWLLLIPAGFAVNRAARLKNPVIVKLLTAVLPVLSTVHACIFFDLGDYAIYIFGALLILPFSLPVLYMAALPYLAIDEIACRSLLKLTGKRPSKAVSVICWVLSFGASAAVLASFYIAERRFHW
ncbi:MAG: hypothetical protein K2K57_14880 [Oscillospiraceae bacterium]|nr:hypothetical protein [Oscillospiraceae bacterium]